MNKILVLCISLCSLGCSERIRAYAEYDPSFELIDYTTYTWSKITNAESGKDSLLNNEINNQRIKSAIKSHLDVRGYSMTVANSDFKIYYHIIASDKSIIASEPLGYSYSAYWMALGTNIFPYREGTLFIDCMDTKTNNLIWRGWAEMSLVDITSSEKMDELIKATVLKIFKKFPNTSKHAYVKDDKI